MKSRKYYAVLYHNTHYLVEYRENNMVTLRKAHPFNLPDHSYTVPKEEVTVLTESKIFLSRNIIHQLNDRCRVLTIKYTKEIAEACSKRSQVLRFYNKRYKNLLILVDTNSYWEEIGYIRVKLLKILCRL